MIDSLKLVKIFELSSTDQSSPERIPFGSRIQLKTRHFEGVDHTVVGMCRFLNFEPWGHVPLLQLLLGELHNTTLISWETSLYLQEGCVRKEKPRLSA
jgi:hypothetical protein